MKLFDTNTNINLIIKTAGKACNIDCEYCFEQAKNVKLYQITPLQLDNVISNVSNTCSIIFHGGEPLIIGLKEFEKLLKVVTKYYPKKVMAVRIQTNGTLLNDDWMNLIYNDYDFLNIEIAISLDGNREMNKFRVDKKGNETFDAVMDAFKLLDRYNKKAGLLSVISRPTLDYAKKYIDLIESIPNIRFVKINALFNILNNKLTYNSITPSEYATFINDIACEYISRGLYKHIAIEPILSIIQRINGIKSKYCNYSDRKCFNYLSVYPEGKIGPCDCFSVDDFLIVDHCITGFLDEMTAKYVESDKAKELKNIINQCSECDIKDFCKGGCISQRYYFKNNEILLKDFCDSKHYLYEKFYGYKIQVEKDVHND